MITQERLKELWDYDASLDRFTWKTATRFRKIGDLVKNTSERITIDSSEYRYSRLKQLYLEGSYRTFTEVSKQITHSQLLTVLQYNSDTGEFTWKESRGPNKVGALAGSLENTGYISIRVGLTSYLAHRLAWFYCFEEWPEFNIDHIDRNPTNNALDNLRDIPQVWNGRNRGLNKNNTSGYVGVYLNKGKWVAEIVINKIKRRLGTFDTSEEASIAYKSFEKENTYENISIG